MTEEEEHGARVVAAVVTYNRLGLLRRLVARLLEIPRLDAVVVVDNASTDGTGAWLAEQVAQSRLIAVTLDRNRGGAGGFHEGMRQAFQECGADLAWLMDDDGLPDPDALDLLLRHEDELDLWGPVVVDQDDPASLVFPIRLPGGTRVARDTSSVARAADGEGLLRDVVIPFNGVLVTWRLAKEIGYPREEFFIWGDDHEYRLRAERAGARIATVAAARVRHPSVGELGTPMMRGRTTYNHSPSDLKHYCMARNNTLNLREYRGWPHVLMFWVKTAWFYTLTRPDPGRLALSARAVVAGLRGDFTGHERLLP